MFDDDLEIVRDEKIKRGTCRVRYSDKALVLPPFDAIPLEHEGDPIAQLEAVRDFVTMRAHIELSHLEARIQLQGVTDRITIATTKAEAAIATWAVKAEAWAEATKRMGEVFRK